jgi:hypothetical protein
MNYLLTLLCGFALSPAVAQQPQFTVRDLSLPKELAFYDNQFSGLSISAGKLFLLSESRLQDKAEAKLYTVPLADLDHKLRDTTYVLPYQKLPLTNLAALRTKINALGQRYEGLEAMLIDQDVVYFSVETDTPSPNCYLLKGSVRPTEVLLDTTFLLPLAKPLAANGAHIYNAGFEALAASGKDLIALFEFNSFPGGNYVYKLDKTHLASSSEPGKLPFDTLPFRLTDITTIGQNHFTALNFFFKGEGGDAIYRTPTSDLATAKLIQANGAYKNYARLLDIELKNNKLTWRLLWELPEQYRGYNWEGIAAYKGGYFLINDKYTPSRPYRTTLLYLQPAAK